MFLFAVRYLLMDVNCLRFVDQRLAALFGVA